MEIVKLFDTKVVETPIYDSGISESGAYIGEDIRFCNTALATEVGMYFRKHGHYPHQPPTPKDIDDKNYYARFRESKRYDEYKAFWDEEENRRRNGIIIPGRLLPDGSMQKVHITGHHYSYLNYCTILHDDTGNKKHKENVLHDKPKFARVTGTSKASTPDFWDGDYHYFKAVELAKRLGLNLVVDKTRQVGYSYKGASIASDIYDLIPRSTVVIGAFDEKYLIAGDATFEMCKNRINHINAFTDWKKSIVGTGVGSKKEIRSGYVYKGSKIKGGFRSVIIPVTFGTNPSAARGKKPFMVFMEEAGKFPNLIDAVIATNEGLREGGIVTGVMIIFGTGGGKPGDWEGFEEIFYNPLEYACLPFKNVWDENMETTTCGFFHGRQYNLKPYYDKDGNSDLIAATEHIKKEREIWKKSGKDDLYKKNVAEKPISPKESFNASIDNIFNTPELIEHAARVEHDTDLRIGMHGLLIREKTGKLRFYLNGELDKRFVHKPIEILTRKVDDDLEGCITIWYHPFRDRDSVIPSKLYYIVHDPYAVSTERGDITHRHSLGCSYVYESVNNFTKGYGDRIVAKYLGRPSNINVYNENLFKLAEYYGCTNRQVWFENNRGDVKTYAESHGYLSWLCFDTDIDSPKEGSSTSKTRNYGINMTPNRKLAAIKYLREWLYRPRGVDELNKLHSNLHTLLDLRLLKELQYWHLKGNFDAVSTMFILMFLEKTLEKDMTYASQSKSNVKSETNSIFNPEYLISKMCN